MTSEKMHLPGLQGQASAARPLRLSRSGAAPAAHPHGAGP
jgi:hypothetical protein